MDVKKASVQELKALAYDLVSQAQNIQRNLQIVENEIQLKLQQEKQNGPKQKDNK